MSATLTVYSIASPRSCAIAAGATTTLRDQARHHVSVRMIVLLEQQTRAIIGTGIGKTGRILARTGGSNWEILPCDLRNVLAVRLRPLRCLTSARARSGPMEPCPRRTQLQPVEI